VEPVWVQLAIAASILFAGVGFFLYIAAWLLIPNKNSTQNNQIAITNKTLPMLVGLVVAFVGIVILAESFDANTSLFVGLAFLAGGLVLLFRQQNISPQIVSGSVAQIIPEESTDRTSTELTSQNLALPDNYSGNETQTHWANIKTETSIIKEKPKAPITATTLAIAALVFGGCLLLASVSESFGAIGVLGAVILTLGIGIVVASIWGRSGKLIFISLLAIVMFPLAPLAEVAAEGGVGYKPIKVSQTSELEDSYQLGMGELELDLSELNLTQDKEIDVEVGAGLAQIIVADEQNVVVNADNQFGTIRIFGKNQDGINNELTVDESNARAGKKLTINANSTYGEINVIRESEKGDYDLNFNYNFSNKAEMQRYEEELEKFEEKLFEMNEVIEPVEPIEPNFR